MNRIHHWYCQSTCWKRRVKSELMPWALGGAILEGPALEIGPGPSITTNCLRIRVSSLTALENDPNFAKQLASRSRNTNVRVIEGDATSVPLEAATFRTVSCFTMLHHLPSAALQDRVLAEALCVLAPGATFLGTDSRISPRMKLFHCFDTLVIVDPATVSQRLRRAGFTNEKIELSDSAIHFRATRSRTLDGAANAARSQIMNSNSVVRSSHRHRLIPIFLAIACICLAAPRAVRAQDSSPCSANPESRQLDFWLGDWTVRYPGISATSSSKVHFSLDKCLVVESWIGGKGHRGENMFAYSSDDKSWHGMFADNEGRVHVFEGKVAHGAAEVIGPNRGPNGEAILNRIKIVRLSDNTVKQTWEKSKDNGATWSMEFQGDYARKQP
jgi:SAM-dependent methyltransferase